MRAADLAGRGRTHDALVAVAVGSTERGELITRQLGKAGVVRRGLFFGGPPLEWPEVQERFGGSRTEQCAVGADGSFEGAPAAPIPRVQVHDQGGPGASQRRSEGLGVPVGVSAVDQYVAQGDSAIMEAHEGLGHGRGGVDTRGVDGDAPDKLGDSGAPLVAHHGGHLGVVAEEANRGIGQALVEEALRRGAARVYAGTRQPISHADDRVTPLTLDITSETQIQQAVAKVASLDVLINNAGVAPYDDLTDRGILEEALRVNFFGPYAVTQACLPLLTRSRGKIVNNVSLMALAPLPLTPSYAISKAAFFNMTQSLRALLAGQGVTVHAVLTGPTDTEMTRGFDIPKATRESVAGAIFDGVENGDEDIFPDPMSGSIAEAWRGGAVKVMERESASFVTAAPVAS